MPQGGFAPTPLPARKPGEEKSAPGPPCGSTADITNREKMGGLSGMQGWAAGDRDGRLVQERGNLESFKRERAAGQHGASSKDAVLSDLAKLVLSDLAKLKKYRDDDDRPYPFRARRVLRLDAIRTLRHSPIETAYWNPSVVIGKDGRGRVRFKVPTALSRYRFTSRGVTSSDTLAEQTTAELRVRKDFLADLKVPSVLTQGGNARFSAQLYHGGEGQGEANVHLAIYAGGRDQFIPKTIPIKGAGVEDIFFDPFEVPDGDVVCLELKAELDGETDTLVVEAPIRPWGAQAFVSSSGTASDDTTSFLALHSGREHENAEMRIVLSPTLRRMLVELAPGQTAYSQERKIIDCLPIPPDTLADRGSDLLAAVSTLGYLAQHQQGRRSGSNPAGRPHSVLGGRTGHTPERGRRLALDQREQQSGRLKLSDPGACRP